MKMLAMCFDRRVLVGLGLVALAIWVYSPQFFFAALPFLILLACPLSMVLMTRMMGGHASAPPAAAADPATQLAALEREQARVAGEIEHVRRAAAVSTPAETQQLPEPSADRALVAPAEVPTSATASRARYYDLS